MSRMILGFLILWTIVMVGAYAYRTATGKQRWEFVKLTAFGLFCATVAMAFLIAVVMLF